MNKEQILDIAKQCGWSYSEFAFDKQRLLDFAKLIAEKAIEPYLPYKQHIETMERAFDAHFKKAMGQE